MSEHEQQVNEDGIFEGLPLKLRRMVLKAYAGEEWEERPKATSRNNGPELAPIRLSRLKVTLAILWGAPVVLAGMVLCLTVIGLPFGLPLLFVGGYPLAKMFMRKEKNAKTASR